MTDLETAKAHLCGHSLCLCRDSTIITADGRGISPMMRLIGESYDLKGYSAADVIVGKAAAMLFVRSGIKTVYGEVMSTAAKAYLVERGIGCSYGTLTEKIANRTGDDVCPMEKTVAALDDADEAYEALRVRLHQLCEKTGG